MLTVMHILGDEPHESAFRSILDGSAFLLKYGVDVRFLYDPSSAPATKTGFLDAVRRLGAASYQFAYLEQPGAARRGFFSRIDAALALREMCIEYKIDVLHTHTGQAYGLACPARRFGAPVAHIYTEHDAFADGKTEKHGKPGAHSKPEKPETPRKFKAEAWCDEFIALSDGAAAAFPAKLAKAAKVKRLNNGIDPARWNTRARNNIRIINETERDDGGTTNGGTTNGAYATVPYSENEAMPEGISTVVPSGVSTAVPEGISTVMPSGVSTAVPSGVSEAAAPAGDSSPSGIWKPGRNPFTLLMIADSDFNGGPTFAAAGSAFDAFADLTLRLLHDFDPGASEYDSLRFIEATDSAPGLRDAAELARALDLDSIIEIAGLSQDDSAEHGYTEYTADDTASESAEVAANDTAEVAATGGLGALGGLGAPQSGISCGRGVFERSAEAMRISLYRQADLCLYYSGNRYFPYAAAESIGLGLPTITNDNNLSFLPRQGTGLPGGSGSDGGSIGDINGGHGGDISGGPGVNADGGSGSYIGGSPDGGLGRGSDGASPVGVYADIDDSEGLSRRILSLIYDNRRREAFAKSERAALMKRYDMADMITGIYDSYIKGLRV